MSRLLEYLRDRKSGVLGRGTETIPMYRLDDGVTVVNRTNGKATRAVVLQDSDLPEMIVECERGFKAETWGLAGTYEWVYVSDYDLYMQPCPMEAMP